MKYVFARADTFLELKSSKNWILNEGIRQDFRASKINSLDKNHYELA